MARELQRTKKRRERSKRRKAAKRKELPAAPLSIIPTDIDPYLGQVISDPLDLPRLADPLSEVEQGDLDLRGTGEGGRPRPQSQAEQGGRDTRGTGPGGRPRAPGPPPGYQQDELDAFGNLINPSGSVGPPISTAWIKQQQERANDRKRAAQNRQTAIAARAQQEGSAREQAASIARKQAMHDLGLGPQITGEEEGVLANVERFFPDLHKRIVQFRESERIRMRARADNAAKMKADAQEKYGARPGVRPIGQNVPSGLTEQQQAEGLERFKQERHRTRHGLPNVGWTDQYGNPLPTNQRQHDPTPWFKDPLPPEDLGTNLRRQGENKLPLSERVLDSEKLRTAQSRIDDLLKVGGERATLVKRWNEAKKNPEGEEQWTPKDNSRLAAIDREIAQLQRLLEAKARRDAIRKDRIEDNYGPVAYAEERRERFKARGGPRTPAGKRRVAEREERGY